MSDSTDDTYDVTFEPDEESGTDAPALAAKLKKVKADLARANKEKEEYLTGWQRAKADYVNAKKRADDDRAGLKEELIARFALELIPVIDSFDQALSHEGGNADWLKGFENVRLQLLAALKRGGVEQFGESGEQFDPELHEAVEVVAAKDSSEDNRVLTVLQKGYRIGERIIRPVRIRLGHYGMGV